MTTTFDLLGLVADDQPVHAEESRPDGSQPAAPRPTRFRLPVREALCTPFRFLYGGAGIAASVEAAERATGRPLMWITTQFLSNAHPDQTVDIDVEIVVEGRATSQVQVTARVEGAVMLTSTCAHTDRPDDTTIQFSSMPEVPPPDACRPLFEPFDLPADRPASFIDSLERRVAGRPFDFSAGPRRAEIAGSDAAGTVIGEPIALWTRVNGHPIGSAASLAYIADIVPLGMSLATGSSPGGTSLDNTLRMVRSLDQGERWVLVEVIPESFQRSIGHGSVRIWSEAGQLLAVAQQSCIVRTSHHARP